MKTPAIKFLLISTVMLFALSGMKGDTSFFCEKQAGSQNADGKLIAVMADMASEHLNKEESTNKKEQTPAFKFPNVFDALRLIF